MNALILKFGREKSLKRRHPWVFSGAVAKVRGNPDAGDTVEVHSATGEFLALAAFSPKSQIVARVWDWNETPIDRNFFQKRIALAVAQRKASLDEASTSAMRLVHGESDGLPGVVADRYGDTLVLQLTSAGAERWREVIADNLLEVSGASRIWERSDAEVRALEGLAPVITALRGAREPTRIAISEDSLQFEIDLERGHKTGFYLDQRDNRRRVRALARGRDVLDGFCYSGGFALNACAGGAKSVTAVDSSAEALALARSNAERNKLAPAEWLEGDVFQLLRPGGLLVTFSCSGGVSADLFQKIVAGAALDAGVQAQIIERLGPGADHPVALNFPEGDYLKGLVCRVAGG